MTKPKLTIPEERAKRIICGPENRRRIAEEIRAAFVELVKVYETNRVGYGYMLRDLVNEILTEEERIK